MIDISEQYIKMLMQAPRELTKPYCVSDHNTIREYRLQILWCTKHRMFVGKDYQNYNECAGMMKVQEKVWGKVDKLKTDVAKDKIYRAFSESDDNCDDKRWIRIVRQDEWQAMLIGKVQPQAEWVEPLHALFFRFRVFVQEGDEDSWWNFLNEFTSFEQLWMVFAMKECKGLVWAEQEWIKEKSNG